MASTETLEIDLESFAARSDTSYVIDVREPAEYEAGHVPGAVPIPLGTLGTRRHELSRDRTVHIICASGNRSLTAAQVLAAAGFDAVSIAGGTTAWARSGRPVITGGSAA